MNNIKQYDKIAHYKQINYFWILWSSLLVACLLLQALNVLHAPNDYHNFVDQRKIFNVHHFSDVLSNILFIFVGLYIIDICKNAMSKHLNLYLLGIGAVLVGCGSAYYHLEPTNASLLWDRLPMAVVFAAIISYSVERLKLTPIKLNNSSMTWLYLCFNIVAVLVWYYGSLQQKEWLGMYFFAQFGGMMLCIYLLVYSKKIGDRNYAKALLYTLVFYGLAKAAEGLDGYIYELTYQLISGHTLKHMLSAVALFLYFNYSIKKILIKTNRINNENRSN